MKILSWNVNGLRAILRKGLVEFLEREQPDILCLQETKCTPDVVDLAWAEGYHPFWNSAERKGYSGVVMFSRIEPKKVTTGMNLPEHDNEGRVLAAEFADFYLVTVYVPNSKRDLSRLDYRQGWDAAFLAYLKKLEQKKPVVFCGDLNVAHEEIDLARPKQNHRTHGFTDEERAGFGAFLKKGFVDTFREFEPDGGHYTWWSQMSGARARGIGWRIDYFLISETLRPRLKRAFILPDVMGSDHCPVGIEMG